MNILLVEDEPVQSGAISDLLKSLGCTVKTAASGLEAEELGAEELSTCDVAFVDFRLPAHDGLQVGKKLRALNPALPLVMLTAFGDAEVATRSLRDYGFRDYVSKPATKQNLQDALGRIKQLLQNITEHGVESGVSAISKATFQEASRVADSHVTVLLRGSRGTGKEVIARYIHKTGKRHDQIFKDINCASIPEHLAESILFGHIKGSFTDAHKDQEGAFEYATDGTIFLDEIGDLPLNLQPKLLRVLETREFSRVGENRSRSSNARVICATNRPLEQLVKESKFRDDLFDRINRYVIHIPSLNDRREDIPLLAEHLLKKQNLIDERKVQGFQEAALELLKKHDWPGNVRELENIVSRCVINTTDDATISLDIVRVAFQQSQSKEASKIETPHDEQSRFATSSPSIEIEQRKLWRRVIRNELDRFEDAYPQAIQISKQNGKDAVRIEDLAKALGCSHPVILKFFDKQRNTEISDTKIAGPVRVALITELFDEFPNSWSGLRTVFRRKIPSGRDASV